MKWLRFIVDPPTTPRAVEKRTPTPKTGVHYDVEWARTPAAKRVRQVAVWGFFKPAIKLYGSPRVIGADRLIDVEGPVVFAANHHSHADTTLLLATIPAHLRHDLAPLGGADYVFRGRISGAISALFVGAIPIERNRLSKLTIKNAFEGIERGDNLLIFPEGGRSPDGWGRPHRPGAAFVASKTGVPVIPTYISGTGRILPKGQNWPTRSRCAVVFGEPMMANEGEDAREFAGRIETTISVLADEFTSGWWEARKKAHAGETADLRGPDSGAWRRRWALGPGPGQARRSPNSGRWPKL